MNRNKFDIIAEKDVQKIHFNLRLLYGKKSSCIKFQSKRKLSRFTFFRGVFNDAIMIVFSKHIFNKCNKF